jgi:hypothetical protein
MKTRTLLTIAALSAAAPALSASLCVSPPPSACRPTIQGAVDAALAGDTIDVGPGTYFENVTIPAGKDGLRLIGAGAAIAVIDAGPPHGGAGVRIESNLVEVAALGIRNAGGAGVSIASLTTGVHVHDLRIVGARDGLGIGSDEAATRVRIVANEIRVAGTGIRLDRDNHDGLVQGNVIEWANTGIFTWGDRIQVLGNRISRADQIGMQTLGASTLIAENTIVSLRQIHGRALAVNGANPIVRLNRLEHSGTFILCEPCASAVVERNVVEGTMSAEAAFHIRAVHPGGILVRANEVRGAVNAAYLFDEGSGVRVLDNSATDVGVGFVLQDFRVVLMRNRVTRAASSGFQVGGESVTLDGNVSVDAGLNGFTVPLRRPAAPFPIVLRNNRAEGSNAAGFAVLSGSRTVVLTGNSGAGNRYDFCNQGEQTDLSGGNAFTTVSTSCDVGR